MGGEGMSEHDLVLAEDTRASSTPIKDRPYWPFRFAERCLYEFHENAARLDILREDLKVLDSTTSAAVPKYDPLSIHGGGPSDNVSARLERIEKLEEDIKRLDRRVSPIQRLIDDLGAPYVLDDSPKAEMFKILELYYFGNNVWTTVARELHMAKRTFFRKREDLVRLAIRYMGL